MRRILSAPLALALLALACPARADVTVAVDPAANAHLISPRIYGLNFPSDAQIDAGKIAVGRWGGNSTSRYNYAIDTTNTAFDYYYENIPGCWGNAGNYCASPPADPKEQSGANAFLKQMKDRGTAALFTIPTIGWVAKPPPKYGHPFDCGCTMPGQDSYDQYDSACGNGQIAGKNVDCGPATNTSVAVDPAWAKAWVQYIVGKFGPANGQRIYALDNEPALWSSTHHDIRGQRLGYDELWQRMRDYAVAILEADPTAEIAGPAEWGWPNYFCSDADDVSKGCSAQSPDRAAHGGEELFAWLLDQAKAYEQKNGKRILHYLDLHYYPQGGSGPGRTRSLWDPTYKDPSWIDDYIHLLPRMHDWADQHYPGTKLSVSEYDFGDHGSPTGAVTYAEVLGIFAREGLDVATAWSPPDTNEAAFAAYALYRNFDGKGGHFEDVSVKATVSGGAGVEAYAAVSDKRVTVVLVNENGQAENTGVTLGNFMPGATAQVYSNNGANIEKQPDAAVMGGQIALGLPPTSITLLVVDGTNPNMLPGGSTSSSASATGATTGAGGEAGSTTATGTSAGSGGSGGSGGSSSSGGGSSSKCGCRVAGDPSADLGVLAGAVGLAAMALGRKRRRR
jgi:Glycoside hydrolase family 44